MATTIKGIYQKSFKCFSDIFDVKEEEEMEIGYPTDVRHVSHIGWDNSSSSAPSWLHEFKTSKDVLEPNSSWPFQDMKSAMEAFGEVENNKEIGRESTKVNLKKKLSSKASLLCNHPWSPRFSSRSSKVLA